MLLLIDVGNTNIVIGLSDNKELLKSWRLSTLKSRTADELGLMILELLRTADISKDKIEAVAVACVVPPLLTPLKEMSIKYFNAEAFIIEPGIKTGMPIIYDNPKEVGADRIVNAVAAKEEYGVPAIIIDFGTATTFDIVSSKGEYLGGVIAPGISISAEALFQYAARLPRVDIIDPKIIIGKNTVSAMQAGIFYGYIGLVDGITERINKEINEKCISLATGGLAEIIAPYCKCKPIIDQQLTLKGIKILYKMNYAHSEFRK